MEEIRWVTDQHLIDIWWTTFWIRQTNLIDISGKKKEKVNIPEKSKLRRTKKNLSNRHLVDN